MARSNLNALKARFRRRFSYSYANTLWFVIAFLVGSILIWIFKSIFSEADERWFPAFLAAGIVIALAVYYIVNGEEEPQEEGDNVYYLGLSFTLVSLMFTLVELFGNDAGSLSKPNPIATSTIIENFGIALLSTVTGIIFRIIVQNIQLSQSHEEDSNDVSVVSVTPTSDHLPTSASEGGNSSSQSGTHTSHQSRPRKGCQLPR